MVRQESRTCSTRIMTTLYARRVLDRFGRGPRMRSARIGGADPLVRGRRPRRPACTLQDADAVVPAAGQGCPADQGVRPTTSLRHTRLAPLVRGRRPRRPACTLQDADAVVPAAGQGCPADQGVRPTTSLRNTRLAHYNKSTCTRNGTRG